jgi:hypothetical protein
MDVDNNNSPKYIIKNIFSIPVQNDTMGATMTWPKT